MTRETLNEKQIDQLHRDNLIDWRDCMDMQAILDKHIKETGRTAMSYSDMNDLEISGDISMYDYDFATRVFKIFSEIMN